MRTEELVATKVSAAEGRTADSLRRAEQCFSEKLDKLAADFDGKIRSLERPAPGPRLDYDLYTTLREDVLRLEHGISAWKSRVESNIQATTDCATGVDFC